MDHWLWTALGALLIRLGMAVHAIGMARAKNSAGIVLRHLADLCAATLAFALLGLAIAASRGAVLGINFHLLLAWDSDQALAAFPPLGAFSLLAVFFIATGIVPGVQAERTRFWPGLASSALLAGLLLPVFLIWTHHNGWLAGRLAVSDSAGALWLHWPGALCAGVGAIVVGARSGKFNRDGSSSAIPGHSVPLAGLGVFVQWVGFVLFIGSSAGGVAAFNAALASAAAGGAALVFSQIRYYKPDIHLTFSAMLGGLVAISACAGHVAPPVAILIGAVAGVLVPLGILLLDVMFKVDDPSGGMSIHGLAAAWGLLIGPLVARAGGLGDRLKGLGANLLGLVAIAIVTIGLSVVMWAVLKRFTRIRAREEDEFDGLDLAEHDIGAYPDFQQTMIKSYHLREV